MKKTMILTFIALMSTQAFAADMRDASFKSSTQVSNVAIDQAKSSINQTMKVADVTADKMKAAISKSLASSAKESAAVARVVVNMSELSRPAFRLTGKGLAMVFKLSGKASGHTLEASKELLVLLDPSSRVSGKALGVIFEHMSEGSEISSDVSTKINRVLSKGSEVSSDVSSKIIEILSEVFEKPLDISSDASEIIGKMLSKGTTSSSRITTNIIGEDNIEAGFKLTGRGISLTSKGIGSVFYVLTKAVTGLTELFDLNKEEIQKAVERNDQETLAGLRELIRAEINSSIEGGEALNQLLSDADLDMYIDLRLSIALEE